MAVVRPLEMARKALATLENDREGSLNKIDRYEQGDQDDPYMPDTADAEYRLLARRAITNVMQFIIGTPAQALAVDSFRRGTVADEAIKTLEARSLASTPEWKHWQRSRLDARQAAVYRGALKFGHSFVATEKDEKKGVISKGLSALRTVALYEDAANDDDPYFTLTVTSWPKTVDDKEVLGKADAWDNTHKYKVTFKSLRDKQSVKVGKGVKHGASVNPVTRFTAAIDLEGRTCGVVDPMIPLQDRINQTVFDLLIVQSFASFKVRTISGMAPPIKMKAVDADGNTVANPEHNEDLIEEWVPVIDPRTGRPIPDEVNINARRVFWAEDEDTKFGTLDETPLDGFIKSIELAFRHIAALSQTPPHHLLGQIANLSAEALTAAETALSRKVDEFKSSFGESWERVFRVAAEIGEYEGAEDYAGEVIWRDFQDQSLAQAADAYGKLAEQLGVPKRGLWTRIPNVTANELATWEKLADDENPDEALAASTRRASATGRPSFRGNPAPDSAGDVAA